MTQEKMYIWTEDTKSGYSFWLNFFNRLVPEAIVQSKKNNSELVKAVSSLLQNDTNKYIIIMDQAFDNPQVIRERKRLMEAIRERNNVYIINIISFEYILLQFDLLTDWVFAEDDELFTKREHLLNVRSRLCNMLNDSNCAGYKDDECISEYINSLKVHNVEQLCAKLLFDITRNTGFEVSKKAIGPCWINNCCEWQERSADDICGLDNIRISSKEKMHQIFIDSVDLVNGFQAAGIGVKSDNNL